MSLLVFFIVLSIVNVIGGTVKSLLTINGGKWIASISNALYFGFYTVVLVYMSCDLPLWAKVAVTAFCNFIGVFIVKVIEKKMRKDRLWKIEFTVKNSYANIPAIDSEIDGYGIPHNYQYIGNHTMFTCYCASQADSTKIKELICKVNGKHFVTESKSL